MFVKERKTIMSLKRCTECGKVVSTHARFCVHCGNEPQGRCKTCVDYCTEDMATPNRPACCTHHPACPAYIYDDPEAVEAYKKKKKKVLKRVFPHYS